MRPFLLFLAVIALSVQSLTAQSFEAASIRMSRESVVGRGFVGLQAGRLLATEATVQELAGIAYGLPPERIIGGPSWTSSTRYNITATTGGQATREQAQQMLQKLLADRFGLTSHPEQRELPVYVLTMARRDGSFGKQLRRSGPECQPMTPMMVNGVAPPPPPPPPPPGPNPMRPLFERQSQPLRCPTMFFPGGLSARAITFDELTWRLSRFLSRPIIDKTGLTGEFDVDLTYQPELAAVGPGQSDAAAGGPGIGVDTGPSIFSAVQDQLGLKLESARAPVEVLVIDGANRPTEN
jgi:uncharacterized protein (TIGR03435 family)